jgi:very-short-patch-repair endonuclease
MKASRRLRRNMTAPEALLRQMLRRSPAGIKFRRQYAIGPYIADFYCPAAKLVIEVDGQIHDFEQQAEHDAARDNIILLLEDLDQADDIEDEIFGKAI